MDPGFSLTEAPVIKIDGDELATGKYTIAYKKEGATTTTVTEADYFEITIPWTSDGTYNGDFLYDANAEILVTYTAKLDPTKADKVKVGKTPNDNIGQIKWFKGKDNPTEPNGELPEVKTKTYDTQLTILKQDEEGNVLTGAEFTLTSTNGTKVVYVNESKYVADEAGTYYKLKDGTYTSEAPNGNATHDAAYDSTTDKYKLVTERTVKGVNQADTTISSFVDKDGKVIFTGLAVGKYKIEETVVPAGYNKVDDIEFEIEFDIDDTDPDNPVGKFSSTNEAITLDEENNVFDTTIVNKTGTELPSTGGMGTTILYILGTILVLGAGLTLITKRRMSAK